MLIFDFFLYADVDECTNGEDDCHDNATCTNIPGRYECKCNSGFKGNGTDCTGESRVCSCSDTFRRMYDSALRVINLSIFNITKS